jgi:hypothetical protein
VFNIETSQKVSVKILVFILIILVIIGGLYFYFNKTEEFQQANTTPITFEVSTSSFLGSWFWMSSDESASFGFNLKQGAQSNLVYGNYCAATFSGNRSDCDPYKKDSFIGILNGNKLEINFVDAYGGGTGTAILTYNSDNSLTWKITEEPSGEYYIPYNVILKKDSKKTEYYNP